MSQNSIFVINMTRKKKEDFFNYVSHILQNSMLTGIPQIAAAGNWPKRITRTLVFFMCVGGFIYQSMSFMQVYWEYDVTMDVRVENPNYDVRPSFTICNKIGFKAQEFCKNQDKPEVKDLIQTYKAWCYELETLQHSYKNFCMCVPRLCDESGRLKYNYTVWYDAVYEFPRNQLLEWLLKPDEIVEECLDLRMKENAMEDCSDPYYLRPGCQWYTGVPEACVTYNSLIGRPNHTLEKVSTDSEIELVLSQHGENYPMEDLDLLMAISIHSPYTIINPLKQGFILQVDEKYNFRLKKVIKKLLPPPYKTNCKDYLSLWHARGGRGPTNLKECIQECQLNLSLAKHGCLIEDIYIPNDETRCNTDITDPTLYAEAKTCVEENCRPACYEEYYTVEMNTWKSRSKYCVEGTLTYERSKVHILLDGMETTTYTYSPKFQDIETFSYLGGYVGMWLGISLVAVFDFFETLIVMLKYPLRRWARFKERRRKIHQMQQFERRH